MRPCLLLVPAILLTLAPASARAGGSGTGAATPGPGDRPLLCEEGKVLLSDNFAGTLLDPGWRIAKGDWVVKDGVLTGVEKAADMHPAVVRHDLKAHDLVVLFSFRFDGGKATALSLNNAKGHVFRVRITPSLIAVQKDRPNKQSDEKGAVLGTAKVSIQTGGWHTLRVEVVGKNVVASLDSGKTIVVGSHDGVDVEKTNFGFPVSGEGMSFKDVRAWEALSPKNPDVARERFDALRTKPASSAASP